VKIEISHYLKVKGLSTHF